MGQVQNKKPDAKKDDKHNQETEGLKKIDTYLRTIPTVTKKFKGRPQKKRSPTSAELLLDPKYSASKEGPFGLGPLVFPCLQRFNNIDCFMIFFIASVLIHALGHSAHLMGYFLGIFGGMKNLSPPPKEKLSAVLGKLGNLTAGCNYHCACTTSLYSSVCGRDEKEYFSPCFAGCSATKVQQNEKTYYNCSCIKEGLTTSDADGHFIDATDGTCNSNCLTLPLFFAFYFSATVFSTMCSTPIILIILQSVPANFSSLGLGVTVAITKFTASVPEPALFGTASSVACKFWDINACGVREKCWIYNKTTLVYVFIGIWVSFKLFTALLNIYAIHIYDYVVKGKISDSKTTHVKASKAQKERRA
ncbi:solute carrier organic anion transporter family, member 6c1 isoform X12 [Rattus norvegicus]|uniref:solute carrier organic anion transporter family, member 6c1 isoform X12 n=1 Tax=Rattus norvegicus TaxID=10116 RepID=UPI002FD8039B